MLPLYAYPSPRSIFFLYLSGSRCFAPSRQSGSAHLVSAIRPNAVQRPFEWMDGWMGGCIYWRMEHALL